MAPGQSSNSSMSQRNCISTKDLANRVVIRSEDPPAHETAETGQARGEWGSKVEFILTCVGYAVGLGNVWRFPYLCYKNGGGAFLIPYVLMLSLVGLPLFFMELSFGQFCSLGPITAWKINPLFKGLGYTMVITNAIVGVYYNVIICWCVRYLFASMTLTLPWTDCNNDWNTVFCQSTVDQGNVTVGDNLTATSNGSTLMKTPSEEYFYNGVLNISSGIEDVGDIQWSLAACLGLCWFLVFIVLIRGIASLGKVVYFSSIFPYVLLTVMLIRGVTLPGALEGIKYYLLPDFSRLMDATSHLVPGVDEGEAFYSNFEVINPTEINRQEQR